MPFRRPIDLFRAALAALVLLLVGDPGQAARAAELAKPTVRILLTVTG